MKFVPSRLTARVRAFSVNRSWLWTFLQIVLALLLVSFVLTQIQLSDLPSLWYRISFPWLFASLLTFYAGIWTMARRYWILVERKIAFRDLLSLSVFQTALGNLLGTTIGTATSIAILRGKHQVQISSGLGLIVLARFLDMLLLLLTLGASSWVLWAELGAVRWVVLSLLGALGGVALFTILLLLLRDRWIRVVLQFAEKFSLTRTPLIARLLDALASLSNADLNFVRAALGSLALYTLATFLLMVTTMYSMLAFFSVTLSIWQIVFILSLSMLVSLFPFQVFGGLGVQDVTTLYLYVLFGYNRSEMAAVIVGTRVLFYLLNLLVLSQAFIEILLERRAGSYPRTPMQN